MYCISICDDDKFARDALEALIRRYFTEKCLSFTVKQFSSGEELCRYQGRTDIAFLDVELGHINGIQTTYVLSKQNLDLSVFIVTRNMQYLDDAMDLNVFRYLNKPIDITRLYTALDVLTERSREVRFMSNHVPVVLKEREIVCVYSQGRRTYVLADSGRSFPTTLSIKEWLSKIGSSQSFSQPHYSYIVNLKYVCSMEGRIVCLRCKNGSKVDIEASQRKLRSFRSELLSMLRQ